MDCSQLWHPKWAFSSFSLTFPDVLNDLSKPQRYHFQPLQSKPLLWATNDYFLTQTKHLTTIGATKKKKKKKVRSTNSCATLLCWLRNNISVDIPWQQNHSGTAFASWKRWFSPWLQLSKLCPCEHPPCQFWPLLKQLVLPLLLLSHVFNLQQDFLYTISTCIFCTPLFIRPSMSSSLYFKVITFL